MKFQALENCFGITKGKIYEGKLTNVEGVSLVILEENDNGNKNVSYYSSRFETDNSDLNQASTTPENKLDDILSVISDYVTKPGNSIIVYWDTGSSCLKYSIESGLAPNCTVRTEEELRTAIKAYQTLAGFINE